MMNVSKGTSAQLGWALLLLGTVLAGWNWYLRPERGVAWAAATFLIASMMLALGLASRRSRSEEPAHASRQIQVAVVFAGLMMALALAGKLASALGIWGDPDLARRGTMVILGLFFVLTGNTIPKTLTPLAALRCDAAKVQAFQRFTGWTWVLTGLGYTTVWMVLPVDVARPVSAGLLVSGMLAIATQLVRLRWSRRTSGGEL